jgi:uncharacterized membrane protein YkvA (DUF1232 family)
MMVNRLPGVSRDDKAMSDILTRWFNERFACCKRELTRLFHRIQTFRLILQHDSAPVSAKIVAGCTLAYLLSPVQLIPSFIPFIGQVDDVIVVLFGIALVRRLTPVDFLTDCEERANAGLIVFRRRRAKQQLATTVEK